MTLLLVLWPVAKMTLRKLFPLLLFYFVLVLIAAAWLVSGPELSTLLFYSAFIAGFSFMAYCGFLESHESRKK